MVDASGHHTPNIHPRPHTKLILLHDIRKDGELEMAGLHRLSAIACQEMTEAVIASNELGMVILDAVSDGKIDAQEIRAIWNKKLELDREMGEAMLAAEESDNVQAHFEFANKRGLYATPHQYLKEKDASLERLRAQYGTAHNKKKATGVTFTRAAAR